MTTRIVSRPRDDGPDEYEVFMGGWAMTMPKWKKIFLALFHPSKYHLFLWRSE